MPHATCRTQKTSKHKHHQEAQAALSGAHIPIPNFANTASSKGGGHAPRSRPPRIDPLRQHFDVVIEQTLRPTPKPTHTPSSLTQSLTQRAKWTNGRTQQRALSIHAQRGQNRKKRVRKPGRLRDNKDKGK
ncbi:hypothetical protein BU26DRAFT_338370 [Trematosphaeria pertusa]|uniref:Uncharacterized protein n=1 Tax=Trematosphaeria pertusa TaxID=390896 RepID=A0A6A6IEF4_9PLEO|nr:uncharacterized protein BU26DRAFT_338370 [Trematosphaeria pertusa]KAF2248579.1 hypothetical protein BU26DRAFT_338370 [Trematosphaeria pertusa]